MPSGIDIDISGLDLDALLQMRAWNNQRLLTDSDFADKNGENYKAAIKLGEELDELIAAKQAQTN